MIRDVQPNSCEAMIKINAGSPTTIVPCQFIGSGRCFKDIAITEGMFNTLIFGNCVADTNDGIENPRKKSPLDKSIQIILDRSAQKQASDPESIDILRPFRSAVIAIAGTPDSTATALRSGIADSEPKTNRFVATIVEKTQMRMLTAIASVSPELQHEITDYSEATTGGMAVLMLLGIAVEPDKIIQMAEIMSATDPSRDMHWPGIHEVRQRLRRDHLGSYIMRDLVDEYAVPGSKFKASPFDGAATPNQARGAFGASMMYDAYMAVGVAKGLAPRPRTR